MSGLRTIVCALALVPRKLGSLEEYTISLAEAVRGMGWRCVLVFTGPPNECVQRRLSESGAIVHILPLDSRVRFHLHFLRILWKYRPQVLHFHFLSYLSLLPVVARLAPVGQMYFTEHMAVPRELKSTTLWKCRVWDSIVLPMVGAHILAVSEQVRRALAGSFAIDARRVRILPNGVNDARFAPTTGRSATVSALREDLRIPLEENVVLSVAHLIAEKGIADLLAAAPRILAAHPQTIFVVVGDGPLAEELQKQARALDIAGRMRFVGLRSDVDSFMALADVVVVPSVWEEPAGLVVLEGMASAKPIVACRVGGIPEYLDSHCGILVAPNAPEQIADAVIRLLDSPDQAQAMGQAGRRRVEANFSMRHWVGRTLSIYGIVHAEAAQPSAAPGRFPLQVLPKPAPVPPRAPRAGTLLKSPGWRNDARADRK
jgi:glycosyltransferase involved in cell wall biosynthesis